MFQEYNFKMLSELFDLRNLGLGVLWVFFVTNILSSCLVAEKLFMNIMHLVTVTCLFSNVVINSNATD
jgi:hypothetical protein